ncbi:DUF3551 domain-containing protein [Rhodopseudomonas boonkerdii]|uniref:DUF3551 domain-containing protein n=1 Tax=Rhodopseudomonas boonkerdii TaxID=475937 RepID=UPI001E489C07|nr:DUF3551 domain-containing protein [Rhodopseudomonas boonkerdii]UGV26081.1 DUF3551 domain-containing protein [Rhodopseudomonas boonkerdii]
MTLYLRWAASAGLAAFLFIVAAPTPSPAAGAQYCIAQSSANGPAAYVGNCIYSDYQQCVAAAVGTRGNCVGNVEYRGGADAAPARPRRGR